MWNKDGKIWYSEQEYKELQDTYNACEKEYKALAKRYHELQAELLKKEV